MSRITSILLVALLLVLGVAIQETAAQSTPGHVYTVRYHKVHPGSTGEYNELYANVVRPVLDKVKADGDIVSYLDLFETFGDRDATHILIVEFENMAQIDDNAAKLEAAAQEVLGMPFQEALGDLTLLREYTGTEVYGSTQ